MVIEALFSRNSIVGLFLQASNRFLILELNSNLMWSFCDIQECICRYPELPPEKLIFGFSKGKKKRY